MSSIKRQELPPPQYEYGGDDCIFVELARDMSFDANFKAQSITRTVRERDLPGIIEVAPGNTSYLVQFDPGILEPDDLIEALKEIERNIDVTEYEWEATVFDIPVLYQDPWTEETLLKFRDRHQDPEATDLEYCAKINGFDSVEAFTDYHSDAPHMVMYLGFIPGLSQSYQMRPRDEQITVPKYEKPRTDTPARAIGQGGSFTSIYPVQSAGGYQLYGRLPIEVIDIEQTLPDFEDRIVLPKSGDILKFRKIDREEYDSIRDEVEAKTYRTKTGTIEFNSKRFFEDPDSYNEKIVEVIS